MSPTLVTVSHVHRAPSAPCPCRAQETRGVLVSGRPRVGEPIRLVRLRDSHLLTTSRVVRVLGDEERLYVETENSIYRIELRAERESVPVKPPSSTVLQLVSS